MSIYRSWAEVTCFRYAGSGHRPWEAKGEREGLIDLSVIEGFVYEEALARKAQSVMTPYLRMGVSCRDADVTVVLDLEQIGTLHKYLSMWLDMPKVAIP